MQAALECELKADEMPPESQHLSDNSLKGLVQFFKPLSDETRLRILQFLHQTKELNVLELCQRLDQRQPSVSHHLALLRVAGLIEMRKEGKHNFYHLQPRRFEQLIATVFNAALGSPFQFQFEDYELRYGPVEGDDQ